MASRFVSGGTIAGDNTTADTSKTPAPPLAASSSSTDTPSAPATATTHHKILPRADLASLPNTTTDATTANPSTIGTATSEEWAAVQATLEADRKRRLEARRTEVEGEDNPEGNNNNMSLYAVLQANKAAKQAAFEESTRLRNQFRTLDDDEIDFLDEVSQQKRSEEERIRRENEEGLGRFRAAQKVGEGRTGGVEEEVVGEEDESVMAGLTWGGGGGGRKRKRERERLVGKRKVSNSTTGGGQGGKENEILEKKTSVGSDEGRIISKGEEGDDGVASKSKQQKVEKEEVEEKKEQTPKPKPKLGLVDYGSDDDDDD